MILRISFLIGIALFWRTETSYIDDSIHHDISYLSIADAPNPEEILKFNDDSATSNDYVSVRSTENERYVCQLPETTEEKIAPTTIYHGASPAELIAPLINDKICTYRQESYWWYELCHGRYILQFHEDKGTKKRLEFYLGNFKQDYVSIGSSKVEQMNPPKRFIDNEERAYYNVSYTHGTHCELINGPRTTNVLYVCSEDHKQVIHSFMELSSCKYEIIVLTNRLCSHPAYKPKPKKKKRIMCYNLDEKASPLPKTVEIMDKDHENTFKNEYIIKILSTDDTEMLRSAVEELMKDFIEPPSKTMKIIGEKRKGWNLPSPFPSDHIYHETVDVILTGKDSIEADHGWWHFEITYGKTIKQVHYEGNKRVVEHLLGRFDEAVHKAWVDEKIDGSRKPKVMDNKVQSIAHLYSGGDICHETKAHRSTELVLRCRQAMPIMGTVTLTIEEPSLCQYLITLESDRFCEPIQYADDYGIITVVPIDAGPSLTSDPPPSEEMSSEPQSVDENEQTADTMPPH